MALVSCTATRSPGRRAAANPRMAGLTTTFSVTPSGVLKVTTPVAGSDRTVSRPEWPKISVQKVLKNKGCQPKIEAATHSKSGTELQS